MAASETKIENALNEARILILSAQVLIGISFRAVFEHGFERLPEAARNLQIIGLILMLGAFALLVAPAAYHRIVEEGHNSARLHAFLSRMTAVALLPFATGLGIELYIAGTKIAGETVGAASGIAAFGLSLFAWYGVEEFERKRLGKKPSSREREPSPRRQQTPLADRIKNVLTETRVALPGAQALLGFQFLGILTQSFGSLPRSVQVVHLFSLAAVALATMCLIAPAAWHRIVEDGEDTERFHKVASVLVLSALCFLALGVAGDLYVVLMKVTESPAVSVAAATVALLFFYGLWFGYTTWVRSRSRA